MRTARVPLACDVATAGCHMLPTRTFNRSGLLNVLQKSGLGVRRGIHQADNLRFHVAEDNVTFLRSPREFYDTLLQLTKSAQQQISWSSLYLGCSELEQDLVQALMIAAAKPTVRCNLLFDASRGLRGERSTATMLSQVAEFHPQSVNVNFLLMPQLHGTLRKVLPPRWVEGAAVSHMKVYAVDDCVIISGANLSQDYFSNREDRYVVFRNSPGLARWCHDLLDELQPLALPLDTNTSRWHPRPWCTSKSASDNWKADIAALMHRMSVSDVCADAASASDAAATVQVFPRFQLHDVGVQDDENSFLSLLSSLGTAPNSGQSSASSDVEAHIATGYFNLPAHYQSAVVNASTQHPLHVLTAAPQANGFYGARGIAGALPMAYSEIERSFLSQCDRHPDAHVQMYEYSVPQRTFHAKGVWLLPHKDSQTGASAAESGSQRIDAAFNAAVGGRSSASTTTTPTKNRIVDDSNSERTSDTTTSVTLIGSPNFGRRSVYRDMECQLYLRGQGAAWEAKLRADRDRLFNDAEPVQQQVGERCRKHTCVLYTGGNNARI